MTRALATAPRRSRLPAGVTLVLAGGGPEMIEARYVAIGRRRPARLGQREMIEAPRLLLLAPTETAA